VELEFNYDSEASALHSEQNGLDLVHGAASSSSCTFCFYVDSKKWCRGVSCFSSITGCTEQRSNKMKVGSTRIVIH